MSLLQNVTVATFTKQGKEVYFVYHAMNHESVSFVLDETDPLVKEYICQVAELCYGKELRYKYDLRSSLAGEIERKKTHIQCMQELLASGGVISIAEEWNEELKMYHPIRLRAVFKTKKDELVHMQAKDFWREDTILEAQELIEEVRDMDEIDGIMCEQLSSIVDCEDSARYIENPRAGFKELWQTYSLPITEGYCPERLHRAYGERY